MLGLLMPCGGGAAIPLLKCKLLVGRHAGCDLPLAAASVSARHCVLELRDGYWHVHDLGSSNGTRVNGAACTEGWALPGDEVAIAKLRFTIQYAPPPGQPLPRDNGIPVGRKTPPVAAPETDRAALQRAARGGALGNALGQLVPTGGGDIVPLFKSPVVIGRDADCDLVLASSSVSGKHCSLELLEGYWVAFDLGSHNGIRVNGERCDWKIIAPGAVLSVAKFHYRLVYQPAPGNATAATLSKGLLESAGLSVDEIHEPAPIPGTHPNNTRYSLDGPV